MILLGCLGETTESIFIVFGRHGHTGFVGKGLEFSQNAVSLTAGFQQPFLLSGFCSPVAFCCFPCWVSHFLETFFPSHFALGYSFTVEVNSSHGTDIIAILRTCFTAEEIQVENLHKSCILFFHFTSSLKVYDLNELFFPLVLHKLAQSKSPYPLISVSPGALSDQAVLWNEPPWGYLHF